MANSSHLRADQAKVVHWGIGRDARAVGSDLGSCLFVDLCGPAIAGSTPEGDGLGARPATRPAAPPAGPSSNCFRAC